MGKALSINNFLNQTYTTLNFSGRWKDAFGNPPTTGIWFVWGNSTNGKTSFMCQLCHELCRTIQQVHKRGRGAYLSYEEGDGPSLQNTFIREGMADLKKQMKLLVDESIEELDQRLQKENDLKFVIIDSFQYTKMDFKQYRDFTQRHKENKLLIFTSQADGNKPKGRAADSVRYDADLKIWVEGFRAFSKGRFIGPNGGTYMIWPEGAAVYYGEN